MRFQNWCRSMTERVLNFQDKKRQARYEEFRIFLDTYKMESGGCVDCGYCEHPAALVLDHVDPNTKKATVSTMFTYSHENLLAELAKCVVRCSNCHCIRSFELEHHSFKSIAWLAGSVATHV